MSRRLLVCWTLVAAVACGGASSGPSGPSLSGIWTLRSLNSAALPYRLPYSPSGDPTTILGSTLTISGAATGSYTEVIAVRVTTPARTIDTSLSVAGRWVMNGGSITFNDMTFAEVYQGSFVNDSIVKFVLFAYSGEYSR
jgi:hypothetical protein